MVGICKLRVGNVQRTSIGRIFHVRVELGERADILAGIRARGYSQSSRSRHCCRGWAVAAYCRHVGRRNISTAGVGGTVVRDGGGAGAGVSPVAASTAR